MASPGRGLVQGGEQQFTFLRVHDQPCSLLGLQTRLAEMQENKKKIRRILEQQKNKMHFLRTLHRGVQNHDMIQIQIPIEKEINFSMLLMKRTFEMLKVLLLLIFNSPTKRSLKLF